ncbi:hypothetical protein [Rossellomorea marisflavi]
MARKDVVLEDGTELWNADEDCEHELNPNCWSGVRCLHCGGWYCL